ncbi:hypothetical protein ACWGLF_40845 [Streptomyces puniciscabiei]
MWDLCDPSQGLQQRRFPARAGQLAQCVRQYLGTDRVPLEQLHRREAFLGALGGAFPCT